MHPSEQLDGFWNIVSLGFELGPVFQGLNIIVIDFEHFFHEFDSFILISELAVGESTESRNFGVIEVEFAVGLEVLDRFIPEVVLVVECTKPFKEWEIVWTDL
jgi:hypothetical protein